MHRHTELCNEYLCSWAQGTLSARAWYGGDEGRINIEAYSRIETKMAASSSIPGQAPPDLPSLLLDGRICYIGMAVRPFYLKFYTCLPGS
jgi:hypothetical protein